MDAGSAAAHQRVHQRRRHSKCKRGVAAAARVASRRVVAWPPKGKEQASTASAREADSCKHGAEGAPLSSSQTQLEVLKWWGIAGFSRTAHRGVGKLETASGLLASSAGRFVDAMDVAKHWEHAHGAHMNQAAASLAARWAPAPSPAQVGRRRMPSCPSVLASPLPTIQDGQVKTSL